MEYIVLLGALLIVLFVKTLFKKKSLKIVFLYSFLFFLIIDSGIKILNTKNLDTRIILSATKLSDLNDEQVQKILDETPGFTMEDIKSFQQNGKADIISPFKYLYLSILEEFGIIFHTNSEERHYKELGLYYWPGYNIRPRNIIYIICGSVGKAFAIFIITTLIFLVGQEILSYSKRRNLNKT